LVAGTEPWLDDAVTGAVVIVVILLLFPIAVCLSMVVVAAALGWFVKADVDDNYADTEYLDLGR
jgi:hypothetical protein